MKTIGARFRATALICAAASVLLFAGGVMAQDNGKDNGKGPTDNNWPYAPTPKAPVLAVVGDVACQPGEAETATSSAEPLKEICSGVPQNLFASQAATAAQIEAIKPDIVALVGDEQYQVGQYTDFENSYELTYGAFKLITRPAPGNHEFYTEHNAIGVAGYGYFSYFNGPMQTTPVDTHTSQSQTASGKTTTDEIYLAAPVMATVSGVPDTAGTFTQPIPNSDGQAGHFEQSSANYPDFSTGATAVYANGPKATESTTVGVGDGWYSYNLGSWHLISLNIECETQPGGCSTNPEPGTWFAAELDWLKSDLQANHSQCTAAYWHQPTFSAANSITAPEGPTAAGFWQLLYQYGADVVLNGHDHLYGRYQPLKPVLVTPATSTTPAIWTGVSDPKKGITEFIVGTGGETLDPVGNGSASDPSANANFNTTNLVTANGYVWGVMSMTLNEDGYSWDFETALPDTTQVASTYKYSDSGSAKCHGGPFGDNGQGNDYGQDKN